MKQSHSKLWAKSADRSRDEAEGEYLLSHSIKTAIVSREVCRKLPFPSEERVEIEKVLVEACAYHDLGKAATGFQQMLREPNNYWKHRHETLSTAIAFHLNPQLDECSRFAILTHHRSIPQDVSTEGEKELPWTELPPDFGQYSDATWQQMLSELRENFDSLADLLVRLARALSLRQEPLTYDALLIDLGIDPTWLRRQSRYQQRIPAGKRKRASLLRGLLITSDHMASARDTKTGRHFKPLEVPRLTDYETRIIMHELPSEKPLLPFQQRAGTTKGDAILKAPTGSGKTLAALLWVMRNQIENGRFFYVLPYTASINAMADRLKQIFNANSAGVEQVGVLHHRNADYLFRTMEDDLPQRRNKSALLLSGLAREMYHPIRVCTPHQILRFALCGRGWETGLAEFPFACFVFDEVHAFEPLLAGLTLVTVRLLKSMGACVLFASATIPRFLEKKISSEVGINETHIIAPDAKNEIDREVCNKVRHTIKVREGSLLDSLPVIAEEIKASGETALIVCNHVATSQEVWQKLRNNYGFESLSLLHARFNGRDRNRIEQAISSKAKPPVLVATQAVEVSLDIDYDRGYTEPAPADALGQRFGRINRKGNRPTPAQVIVFDTPSAGYLYDQDLTDKTIEQLRQVRELTEAQLTEIVDMIYGDGYTGAALEDFNRGINNRLINNFYKEIVAGTHRAWTDDILDKSDGQIEVLPDCLIEEFRQMRNKQRYVEARQLVVPIRIGQKFKAEKMGALRYDKRLREFITTLKYSSDYGLDLTTQSENIF